ncbi:MAG: hypothetical protein MJK14_25445 [Rivularia sp. ALOHA_DT_140]|nr:hypothetical protein [Rivularia sp. ALOHA_DT_140]
MTEFNEMFNLLEAERERYVLEAARLERRLESVHTQINAIDKLISGYIEEKQHHQFYQLFPQSQTQAYLEEDRRNIDILSADEKNENKPKSDVNLNEEIEEGKFNQVDNSQKLQLQQEKLDTSDIPKMKGGRQSESLRMLLEFQGYSIRNAILILMRRQPHEHFHINVIFAIYMAIV